MNYNLLILLFSIIGVFTCDAQYLQYDHLSKELQLYSNSRLSPVPTIHFRNTGSGDDWILRHNNSSFHIQKEAAAGNEIITFQNSGRVGIGTVSPNAHLHVLGNSSTGFPNLLLQEDHILDFARLGFKNNSSTNMWELAGSTSGSHPISEFNLFYNGYGNLISAKGNGDIRFFGNIGINELTPEHPLDITLESEVGTAINIASTGRENYWEIGLESCPADGSFHSFSCLTFSKNGSAVGALSNPNGWLEYSDASLKKNVSAYPKILDKILDMSIHHFHFTHQNSEDPLMVGIIAQELEKDFPELVVEIGGAKAVAYNKLGVLAVKAIQEQQELIEIQDKKIRDFEISKAKHEELLKILLHRIQLLENEISAVYNQKLNRD